MRLKSQELKKQIEELSKNSDTAFKSIHRCQSWLQSDEYLSALQNNDWLSDANTHFVKKNLLSLLVKFMDTKCTIIEELPTLLSNPVQSSSWLSLFRSSKPKQPPQSGPLLQAPLLQTPHIVGGLHNLHISPIMHNDYRKRKSRKLRKLRKLRKSRKLKKLKKLKN